MKPVWSAPPRRKGTGWAGALAALLAVLVFAAPAAAQSSTNTAGIEGKITDESGAVLPGATVTISSSSLQTAQLETVSDDAGRYRFAALPRGEYAVTFALSGFQTLTRKGLNVDAGFIASLDAKLNVGQLEETVVVTGESPVIDVRTTTVVSNIKKEVLETLPTSRSYEDMGKLAPGVRVSGVPDVGGNHTGSGRGSLVNYGSSNGGSTLMLDGVNTDGTAGYYDMGAIDEMIVRPAGNDPEIATPGMAFQVIVRSGSNTFHGTGLYAFQNKKLQSDNVDDNLRKLGVASGNPMDSYYDANGSLGGRVLPDRLWFFGSLRRKQYRTAVLGFAGGPGPDGAYFTADDEQGYTWDRESSVVGKLNAQLSKKQSLSYMHHYNMKRTPDNHQGNAFKPHEATGDYSLPNTVFRGEYSYALTDRSLFRAGVGRSFWNSRSVPYTDKPPQFDTVTQRWLGAQVNSIGSDSTPAGSESSRWQYDLAYTYFRPNFFFGDHEFKVGGYFTREWYNKFQEARGPGTGGTGHDYLLTFSNGTPIEVLLYNSPFVALNNVNYQSGYIRDDWRIGDRLTIDIGLRAERYDAYLPAQSKPEGPFSQAASYPFTSLYDWRAFAPRFGVSYALTADKRTAIKATYGIFNFAVRASDSRVIRNFNKNDYSATRYRWNDLNGNRDLDYPREIGDFIGTEGGSSTVYNPDISQPRTHEVTFHIEQQLATGFAARAGYVFKKEANQFQLVNTLRPYSAYNIPITVKDPGPDGVVGNADDGGSVTYYDYSADFRGPAFERFTYINTPGYTDRYHNFEFGLDKRMSNRWQLMASYLATRKNVWIAGVPVTPNDEFYPRNETWETTIRVSGSYQAPFGIQAAAIWEMQSGAALARDVLWRTSLRQLSSVTLRMEPLGAQSLPDVKLLNVRLAKQVALGGPHKVSIEFDLYNALNANAWTGQTVRSGPTYGRITGILPPRVARLGVSYAF